MVGMCVAGVCTRACKYEERAEQREETSNSYNIKIIFSPSSLHKLAVKDTCLSRSHRT